MALDAAKTTLSKSIVALIKGNKNGDNPDAAIKEFADGMTDIIIAAIKSGTVTVSPGIAVSVAGSAVAQTGATTAPGTGTIN